LDFKLEKNEYWIDFPIASDYSIGLTSEKRAFSWGEYIHNGLGYNDGSFQEIPREIMCPNGKFEFFFTKSNSKMEWEILRLILFAKQKSKKPNLFQKLPNEIIKKEIYNYYPN